MIHDLVGCIRNESEEGESKKEGTPQVNVFKGGDDRIQESR